MTIRPFQAGRPPSAFSRSTQRTATSTTSALAASLAVPALIEGPSSPDEAASDSGPRLFAIVAEIPLFASSRAALEPRAPAPIMPILILCSYIELYVIVDNLYIIVDAVDRNRGKPIELV